MVDRKSLWFGVVAVGVMQVGVGRLRQYDAGMRAVVQRVTSAQVTVGNDVTGQIGIGLVVLVGIMADDVEADLNYIASKLTGLRVFEDDDGKMNRSIVDVGGSVLLVSQFTLAGDARKGRRPSFVTAAHPEKAEPMYDRLVAALREQGLAVETGRFRTHMNVELTNDGPVTILLDSQKTF